MQVVAKPVELVIPECAILFNPPRRAAHWRTHERRVPGAPHLLHAQQPGALEHLHMLRHRRQRHVEPPGEFADGFISAREARKNLPSG